MAKDPLPSTSTRQSGRTTDDTLGFPDPTETLGDAQYGSWSSKETVTMSLRQPAAGSNSPTNLQTSSESSPRTSPQPVDRRPRGPPGSPRRRNPTILGLRRGRMPGRAGMICALHLCCSTSRIGVGQRFGNRRTGAADRPGWAAATAQTHIYSSGRLRAHVSDGLNRERPKAGGMQRSFSEHLFGHSCGGRQGRTIVPRQGLLSPAEYADAGGFS